MHKSDFDDYFEVLGKASDRSRSFVYVFIIVSIATLLYALNAFAYPAQQNAYNDLITLTKSCYPKESSEVPRPDLGPKKCAEDLDVAMEKNLWSHKLQLSYDGSTALRTFKFPFFGLESDRDLLWLIFPVLGIIGYSFVLLAFGRQEGMFRFLLDHNQTDVVRLRLIQSTTMLTVPLGSELHVVTPVNRWIQRILAVLLFALPIIVTLLTIADLTNAFAAIGKVISQVKCELPECKMKINLWKLIPEIVVLLLQLWLFGEVILLGRRFGGDQSELVERLNGLRASALGMW